MSEALRGFVLLLSVVLWLPVLPAFLDGAVRTDEAVLRYAGALLLSWGGVSAIAALVRAYTPEPAEPEPVQAPAPGPAGEPSPGAAPAAADRVAAAEGGGEDGLPDGAPRRRADDLTR